MDPGGIRMDVQIPPVTPTRVLLLNHHRCTTPGNLNICPVRCVLHAAMNITSTSPSATQPTSLQMQPSMAKVWSMPCGRGALGIKMVCFRRTSTFEQRKGHNALELYSQIGSDQ